ncbi:unnamed protein product [Prorocentrum cordatum]|uniref:Uncharacterized protein n=1 Tax=Prorocentrum cordatum TaxID=2364126 RepID=A0ABN9V9F1_9DINO|nr:unnamed protein product [Polarella glacialis]
MSGSAADADCGPRDAAEGGAPAERAPAASVEARRAAAARLRARRGAGGGGGAESSARAEDAPPPPEPRRRSQLPLPADEGGARAASGGAEVHACADAPPPPEPRRRSQDAGPTDFEAGLAPAAARSPRRTSAQRHLDKIRLNRKVREDDLETLARGEVPPEDLAAAAAPSGRRRAADARAPAPGAASAAAQDDREILPRGEVLPEDLVATTRSSGRRRGDTQAPTPEAAVAAEACAWEGLEDELRLSLSVTGALGLQEIVSTWSSSPDVAAPAREPAPQRGAVDGPAHQSGAEAASAQAPPAPAPLVEQALAGHWSSARSRPERQPGAPGGAEARQGGAADRPAPPRWPRPASGTAADAPGVPAPDAPEEDLGATAILGGAAARMRRIHVEQLKAKRVERHADGAERGAEPEPLAEEARAAASDPDRAGRRARLEQLKAKRVERHADGAEWGAEPEPPAEDAGAAASDPDRAGRRARLAALRERRGVKAAGPAPAAPKKPFEPQPLEMQDVSNYVPEWDAGRDPNREDRRSQVLGMKVRREEMAALREQRAAAALAELEADPSGGPRGAASAVAREEADVAPSSPRCTADPASPSPAVVRVEWPPHAERAAPPAPPVVPTPEASAAQCTGAATSELQRPRSDGSGHGAAPPSVALAAPCRTAAAGDASYEELWRLQRSDCAATLASRRGAPREPVQQAVVPAGATSSSGNASSDGASRLERIHELRRARGADASSGSPEPQGVGGAGASSAVSDPAASHRCPDQEKTMADKLAALMPQGGLLEDAANAYREKAMADKLAALMPQGIPLEDAANASLRFEPEPEHMLDDCVPARTPPQVGEPPAESLELVKPAQTVGMVL